MSPTRLNCPCGCKTNMACRMDPYPCRTCWDNKKKILKMQQAGMSDRRHSGSVRKEMGPSVVAVHPGTARIALVLHCRSALGLFLVHVRDPEIPRKEGRRPPLGPLSTIHCSTGITIRSRRKWKSSIDDPFRSR